MGNCYRSLAVSSDFDHDLAKGSLRKMLVGFLSFLEWVHLIDHGTNPVFGEENIHPIKR